MTYIVQPAGLLDLPRHVLTHREYGDLTYQLDLGNDHWLTFVCWEPDLRLNPQYAHLAHLIRTQPVVGANVIHRCATESGFHEGAIHFKTELTQSAFKGINCWDVHSWSPLHIEPSLLSHCPCHDHGHIRGGKWERV